MRIKAWQAERDIRRSAVPLDRRLHPSSWCEQTAAEKGQDEVMLMLWESSVPGSGAPECLYREAAQSMENRGFDESVAVSLIPEGLHLARSGDAPALRVLTAHYLDALFAAPQDPLCSYLGFEHPAPWDDVLSRLPAAHTPQEEQPDGVEEKTLAGWVGQLAGGAFGTAIEGYTGQRISEVYGDVRSYVTDPETMNDDVVYELTLLDAFELHGRGLTSQDIAEEWLRQVPFGWSAEWVALQNLRAGLMPPESGNYRNPYSDWIGVQMRGMICGMLAPGRPLEAVRLAHLDGVVSHAANGVYGGMYAAALTALAYVRDDPRVVAVEAAGYVPRGSEYAFVLHECLDMVTRESDVSSVLAWAEQRFEQYNWIHAYPNMAADVISLWYGERDITESFALLARGGLDIDCNAGLVGTVLGAMSGVPAAWADPIGDLLETYVPGKERLSIHALAERTARLARGML
ncbi:MAG: ADP-ribosylglycohydrolase family protein [Coprothermobacter sp.]|jgi:ADP-ribosylglycohydrolase|nr:ADP-ribosylglycohydrolase family protein [Coprothermobacter sp.]